MTDAFKPLIERLRDPALMKRWWDFYGLEAADEIERLRAALETADKLLREAFDPIQDHHDDLGDLPERIAAHVNATLLDSSSAPSAAAPSRPRLPPEGVVGAAVGVDPYHKGPFLVADSGGLGEHHYRTLIQGVSQWTLDPQEALWFARRRDAELYAAEDEDAWCILPVPAEIPEQKP